MALILALRVEFSINGTARAIERITARTPQQRNPALSTYTNQYNRKKRVCIVQFMRSIVYRIYIYLFQYTGNVV